MSLVKIFLSVVFIFIYFKIIQVVANTIGLGGVGSSFNLIFIFIILPFLLAFSIISSQKLIGFILGR